MELGRREQPSSPLRGESRQAAVLDVDLRGETSARVAEALAARGIPFVVMSGYGPDLVREAAFEGRIRLTKPVDPIALVAALASVAALPG